MFNKAKIKALEEKNKTLDFQLRDALDNCQKLMSESRDLREQLSASAETRERLESKLDELYEQNVALAGTCKILDEENHKYKEAMNLTCDGCIKEHDVNKQKCASCIRNPHRIDKFEAVPFKAPDPVKEKPKAKAEAAKKSPAKKKTASKKTAKKSK